MTYVEQVKIIYICEIKTPATHWQIRTLLLKWGWWVVGPGRGGLAGCVRLRTADRSNQWMGGGGGSAQESGHRRVGGGRWALRDAQRAEVGIGGSEMFGYGQGFSFWSRRQAARSGVAGPIMPTAGIPTRTLSTQLGGLLGKICCSDRGGAVLRMAPCSARCSCC